MRFVLSITAGQSSPQRKPPEAPRLRWNRRWCPLDGRAGFVALRAQGETLIAVGPARSWIRLVDMVGKNATPAAYESARRALYRLRQQGVIQIADLTTTGVSPSTPT